MHLIDGAVIWRVKATHGLPLDFALARLAQSDCVPTWDALLDAALADGASVPKLVRELDFYIREAYAPDMAEQILPRLTKLGERYS